MTRILVLIVIAIVLAAGWFGYSAYTPLHAGAPDSVVEIHHADSHSTIARLLTDRGAIDDPEFFNWVGRVTRRWNQVKAGEYKVSASMSPMEIFAVFSGPSLVHPMTVREGENMYEIADDLEEKRLAKKADFLALCHSRDVIQSLGLGAEVPTLEGYLYPETYHLNKTMHTIDIIRLMVHHANQMWTAEDESAARLRGMSRFQIVTLASMIEKETGAPNERPMISSVFYNRLKKKMRLQSDPTTIYGIWERYQGKIHKTDLLQSTPYNTYTVNALPLGPIGNPGRDAITAALSPVSSEFLYFVSHNDGTHHFSRSLAEHNQAVRKFQLDPKAREGKSWRDLSKKTSQ